MATALALAGLFFIARAVVSRLLVALHIRGGRPGTGRARTVVGQRLPTLRGRTLSGRDVVLPDDATGKVTCLVCGFAYEARFPVEDWVRAWDERFGQREGFTLYEVAMISNLYRPMAPVIESGMRQGTPESLRDRVVTVWARQGRQRASLGADSRSDTWVFALDGDGTVLYEYGGAFDEARFAELASALNAGAGAQVGGA